VLAAAMAKAYGSDAYRHVAAEGIQIHGGIGFTWEHDMHVYFKRAKSSEVGFGDAALNREAVARLIGL
jgi:alkylation response protein AidB-like acyl-CoA dehydrogenase